MASFDFAMLAVPATLTDIAEIRKCLLDADAMEKALNIDIAEACAGIGPLLYLDADVLRTVTELDKAAPGIHSTATSTVTEAERIISRTRQLDAAHARVQQVRW